MTIHDPETQLRIRCEELQRKLRDARYERTVLRVTCDAHIVVIEDGIEDIARLERELKEVQATIESQQRSCEIKNSQVIYLRAAIAKRLIAWPVIFTTINRESILSICILAGSTKPWRIAMTDTKGEDMKATLHDHATFQYVSRINRDRAMRWHKAGLESWSPQDWACAMAGEAGELCNVIKKMRRVEGEIVSANNPEADELIAMARQEIGDTFAYLDLLCQRLGLDMYDCISHTFNRISEREGFPERLI